MEISNNEKPRVILSTTRKDLEDLMLSEYPGRIFQHQCRKYKIERQRIFHFYNLSYDTLKKFLDDRNFKYDIEFDNGNKNSGPCYKFIVT